MRDFEIIRKNVKYIWIKELEDVAIRLLDRPRIYYEYLKDYGDEYDFVLKNIDGFICYEGLPAILLRADERFYIAFIYDETIAILDNGKNELIRFRPTYKTYIKEAIDELLKHIKSPCD